MYTAVKVFSVTKARERVELGERITRWMEEAKPAVVDTMVVQSSDTEFHCLTVVVFYNPKS